MTTIEHEVFRHRCTRVGSDILQGCWGGCAGNDHRGVFHSTVTFQCINYAGNGRIFLTDCNVETFDVLAFLIQDRVNADGCLASFSVTNHKLSLAAANRCHRVDRFDTRLHWLGNGLPFGNTCCDDFNRACGIGLNRSLAVQCVAQRIEYATDDCITCRNRQQCSECFDFVAFLNGQEVTENDHADGVFLEVERESNRTVGKLNHLTGHDSRESVNASDAVTNFKDGTDFANIDFAIELLNLFLQD